MLQPKRVKYRKVQKAKGNMKGIPKEVTNFLMVCLVLKSLEQNLLTSRQIEAARVAATSYMKRQGIYGLKFFRISRLPKNH